MRPESKIPKPANFSMKIILSEAHNCLKPPQEVQLCNKYSTRCSDLFICPLHFSFLGHLTAIIAASANSDVTWWLCVVFLVFQKKKISGSKVFDQVYSALWRTKNWNWITVSKCPILEWVLIWCVFLSKRHTSIYVQNIYETVA